MHQSQLWPGTASTQGPPTEDDPYYCTHQWHRERAYGNHFLDNTQDFNYEEDNDYFWHWRGLTGYNTCPHFGDRWMPALSVLPERWDVPGRMIRPIKFFGAWNQDCTKDRSSITCAHELRSAWQAPGMTNQIVHDGLSVDSACIKTSRTAHHNDGTGMSIGIAPGELAETQSFTFTMYIGARETAAQADVIAASLPGVKFWATAWAGAATDNGNPATFFYAFDIPAGGPLARASP
jgi:hypothetical protein